MAVDNLKAAGTTNTVKNTAPADANAKKKTSSLIAEPVYGQLMKAQR